ncbi:MAG: hypothetical protein GXY38_10615 [Planctomycetes bacterium]|jgi:hypothetical protein|nr:hypothetical protein [Planctomycetota bacterium]
MSDEPRVRTACLSQPASPFLVWSAAQAGVRLLPDEGSQGLRGDLSLLLDPSVAKARGPLLDERYVISFPDERPVIASADQEGLARALLDIAEGALKVDKPGAYEPMLALRSFHMWLPFGMGQGYGQQGYDSWKHRTDWWWYSRRFWSEFLDELALARYNHLFFWNVHPFPALIEYEEFPEANEFDSQRRMQNIEHFRWLLRQASSCGIKTGLLFYNIQVGEGFGRAHGFPCRGHYGYVGSDCDLVRDYNRYCLHKLMQTYPDLSGLMSCFEINKDAHDYVRDVIVPPLKQAAGKPVLHFRLWGQHFPAQVRDIADMLPGRFVLWHKICEESVGLPMADARIAKWRQAVPQAPLSALCGSGNAAGHFHSGWMHLNPESTQKQLEHLRALDGNGIGLFCGMDNNLNSPVDPDAMEPIMLRWHKANWLSRQVVGRQAWFGSRMPHDHLARLVDRQFHCGEAGAGRLLSASTAASRPRQHADMIVNQYGQNLGMMGLLGRTSMASHVDEPGCFRMTGPYAWPFHDFGLQQPDVAQIGRSPELLDRLIEQIRQLIDEATKCEADLLEVSPHAQELVQYIRLNALTGMLMLRVLEAAARTARLPHVSDVDEALDQLDKAVQAIDAAHAYADPLEQLIKDIPVLPLDLPAQIPTSQRLAGSWMQALLAEQKEMAQLRDHLRRRPSTFPTVKSYWQSYQAYLDLNRLVYTRDRHLNPAITDAARRKLQEAVGLAKLAHTGAQESQVCKTSVEGWLTFLASELERAGQPHLEIAPEGQLRWQPLRWIVAPFFSPCGFTRFLLSTFEPNVEFAPHAQACPLEFALAPTNDSLRLFLRCEGSIPDSLLLFLSDRDEHNVEFTVYPRKASVDVRQVRMEDPHGAHFTKARTHPLAVDISDHQAVVTLPRESLAGIDLDKTCRFNIVEPQSQTAWCSTWSWLNWWDRNQNGTLAVTRSASGRRRDCSKTAAR